MIIEKHHVGAHSGKVMYAVCNDVTETGEDRPHEIARYDTLQTATAVLRYLRGDNLNEYDTELAREAIAAAPTD